MDLVIGNATVITMNAAREVLRDAEVVVGQVAPQPADGSTS